MALKLNRPVITAAAAEAATNTETARFIAGAVKKTAKNKGRLLNFRLTEAFEDILEAESVRTGQSKATIMRAALVMYHNQDENAKNYYILESAKR